MKRLAFVALLAVCIISGCQRPTSIETFVKVSEMEHGSYRFTLDMSDSLSRYDLSFYTHVDNLKKACSIPLHVVFVSPSDKVYDEMVYLNVKSSGDALEAYRTDCVPSEFGVWKLMVSPEESPAGLRGMGLIVETKND